MIAAAARLKAAFAAQYLLIWVLLAMSAIFWWASPAFRTPENLLEVIRGSGIIAVLVLGLTWIAASGEIDVSYPEIAGFASVITAWCVNEGVGWAAAPMVAVAAGTAMGIVSGMLVVVFKLPSLIATIAVGSIARAVASLIGEGGPIYVQSVPSAIEALVFGKILGVPYLILVVVGVYFALKYLQDHTTMGQHLYALGENRQAALEAGIQEKKIMLSFFVLSALLASCGGILIVATFSSGQPRMGGSFFIDGLTAVFLGALIIKAGKPNVIGTLLGAIFLSVLGNGITLLGVPSYVGYMIKGALMVFGVVIIAVSRYRIAHAERAG